MLMLDSIRWQVLPAFLERFAMTTWFYGTPGSKAPSKGKVEEDPMAVIDVEVEAAALASTSGTEKRASSMAGSATPQVVVPSNADGVCSGASRPQLPVATAAAMSHVSVTCAGGGGGPHPCIADRPPLPSVYATSADSSSGSSCSNGDNYRNSSDTSSCSSSSSSNVEFDDAADEPETGTIFVSIASFRDSECQHTLRDLFETALYPNRVFVGVVGQYNDAEDAHCFTTAPLPEKWAQQVRCLSIPAVDARGPCWARHWAAQLHRDETFYLQIDSHMRFRPNWFETHGPLFRCLPIRPATSYPLLCSFRFISSVLSTLAPNPQLYRPAFLFIQLSLCSSRDAYLISCLAACPSSKPVLTAYPPAYTLLKEGTTSGNKSKKAAAAAAAARPIGHAVVAPGEVCKGMCNER